MMNAAIVEIMNSTGHTLPEAHSDARLMAELAADVHEYTGFENLGIPFCMTVEAEVLGSAVNYGTLACEPKIVREVFTSAGIVQARDIAVMLNNGRIGAVVEAAGILARRHPDIPVIGNLTGPVSTAASLIDPVTLLKEFRKNPSDSHRVLDYVTHLLIGFAERLVESGVTLISIGDPTATGEILGPKMFREYAVRYINRIIDSLHRRSIPVIVHICGNMNSVRALIPEIRANAISTDAVVNLRQLKAEFPQLTTMGNLSTYLLEFGPVEKVASQTRQLVRDGVNIISPACGLSTSTSRELIRAMTAAVKEG
jgi:[methyl-Co(III) methanol-specific corrinoid protein]:coenzyme M methyltransferase